MPAAGGTGIKGGLVMPQSRYFRPSRMPRPINQGSDIERAGQSIGQAIEGFGDLFKKIRQDKIANDLMNQGPTGQPGGGITTSLGQAPGAATDQPAAQDFSLPSGQGIGGQTVGSLIHTGGVDELAMRQAYQKAQTAQALEEAKLADFQAKAGGTGKYAPKPGVTIGGGSGSRWQQQTGQTGGYGAKPQKPAPYVAGSSDPNDPESDDMAKIRADYDLFHGKGSFDKAQQNISQWQIQNGQYVLPKLDKQGNPIKDENGNPVVTQQLSVDEGNKLILRTNAARIAQGQPQLPVPVPVGGSNPKSTQPAGSIANPYKPTNPLEARGIPNDSYMINPMTGETVLKKADPNRKPQGQAAAQPAESTQDTSSTDNQGLGDEELANEATASSDQDSSAIDDAIDQDKAKRDLYA